jgi:Flp pilus assembly protein TadG
MWIVNAPSRRDERGAVAVIFAICAVMIFGLAAMGVDLGNAMNRKKLTQNNADLAALAGAPSLPASDATGQDAVRQQVASWLNTNSVVSDGINSCRSDPSVTSVTAGDLGDGNKANGEVTFPTSDEVRVVSPPAKVTFGLANAIGFSDTCVQSVATAAIKSGGTGMAPYYATSNCDNGYQTLKSNAAGLTIPPSVPTLYANGDTNSSTLSSISPNQIPVATAPTDPASTVTLTGTNLGPGQVDQVGFFSSDYTTPPVIGTIASSPAQASGIVAVDVPYAVASVQDIWYVRVHSVSTPTTPGKWSSAAGSMPLIVGAAVLSCDPDAATGNFGSLNLPGWKNASGVNGVNDELAMNIAAGLKSPLSLTTYDGVPFPTDKCPAESSTSPTVISDNESDLQPNTNCVYTSTGLDTTAATEGFITEVGNGADHHDGKLIADTSQACTDLGRDDRYPLTDPKTGNTIDVNGDLLTCFFADPTTTINQAVTYSGSKPIFTQDIWNSPRFFLVPVFDTDPPGSKPYPIKRFVAGFITDQPSTASQDNMDTLSGSAQNGLFLSWKAGKPSLGALSVVFFPTSTLPDPPDGGPLVDYFGSGPKVAVLLN